MKQLKLSIYILLVLSLLSFMLTFLLYSKRENEKAKRIAAEAQVAELKDEKQRLTAVYDTAKKDLAEAKEKLEEESRRAQELEQELIIEKREKEELAGQVTTLSGNLDTLNQEYEDAQTKYEDLARVVKRLKKKFEETQKRKSSDPVELPAVVVKPVEPMSGRVLVVNDVFRFVVVNLGREDGLHEGAMLEVVRDGNQAAQLQVERLYDSLAACAIVNQVDSAPIAVQDMVKTV